MPFTASLNLSGVSSDGFERSIARVEKRGPPSVIDGKRLALVMGCTGTAWSMVTSSMSASTRPSCPTRASKGTREHVMPPADCRALVALDAPYLERDGKRFRGSAGMVVSAEVNLGSRTVIEYLLSPVQKVTHETGREM